MALSRWSPVGEPASLHSAMDKLFSDFFGTPTAENGFAAPTWYLPLDVRSRRSRHRSTTGC